MIFKKINHNDTNNNNNTNNTNNNVNSTNMPGNTNTSTNNNDTINKTEKLLIKNGDKSKEELLQENQQLRDLTTRSKDDTKDATKFITMYEKTNDLEIFYKQAMKLLENQNNEIKKKKIVCCKMN